MFYCGCRYFSSRKYDKISKKYPERFINVGVSELVMIGVCAGLALQNKKVFAYTIATFTLYRPFEILEMTYAIVFQLQLLEWEQGQFTTI